MNDFQSTPEQEKIARWALLGIGTLMLYFCVFTDPVGDSSIWGIEIGVLATRILLSVFGLFFSVAVIAGFLKKLSK